VGEKNRKKAARIQELSFEDLREIAADRPDQANELFASFEIGQELHELIKGAADEAAEDDPWVVLWVLERCILSINLDPQEFSPVDADVCAGPAGSAG
jgi:hypothetical protein